MKIVRTGLIFISFLVCGGVLLSQVMNEDSVYFFEANKTAEDNGADSDKEDQDSSKKDQNSDAESSSSEESLSADVGYMVMGRGSVRQSEIYREAEEEAKLPIKENETEREEREEDQAVTKTVLSAHRDEFFSQRYSGVNTYPWQADCPGRADTYGTSINGRAMGGYVCECVSYAGWKAYEKYGVILSWGNANTWDDVGRIKGIVDHVPTAHTIIQTDIGGYGHVMWAESVNADGSVNITEYNNAFSSASGMWHDFGGRVIPASQASSYNYIHIDKLNLGSNQNNSEQDEHQEQSETGGHGQIGQPVYQAQDKHLEEQEQLAETVLQTKQDEVEQPGLQEQQGELTHPLEFLAEENQELEIGND